MGTAAALFNGVPAAQAQATSASTGQPSTEGCSAAALRGTYVVSFNGQGTSTPPQFSESSTGRSESNVEAAVVGSDGSVG